MNPLLLPFVTTPIGILASQPAGVVTYPYTLTLTNPDAETGDMTGWTTSTGVLVTTTTAAGKPDAQGGNYFFFGGSSNATSSAYQDIVLPIEVFTDVDAGTLQVVINWFANNNGSGDTSGISIEFFNSVSSSLGVIAADQAEYRDIDTWIPRIQAANVPSGTRTIRVKMEFVRSAGSSDGNIDVITATLIEQGLDPFWQYVGLQSIFSGVDGSTSFTDQSASNHSLIAAGNAQILSNKLELDGTGDYVSSPDHSDFTLNKDFTIELFGLEFDTVSVEQNPISHWATGALAWILGFKQTPILYFGASTNGSTATFYNQPWSPSVGTAYDITIMLKGAKLYFYVNGSQIGSFSFSPTTIFNSSSSLAIGTNSPDTGGAATSLNGRLSAVRITNAARYSGTSYTVPSIPFPTG